LHHGRGRAPRAPRRARRQEPRRGPRGGVMTAATERRSFAIYAITRHGLAIAARLAAALPGAELIVSEKLHAQAPPGARRMPLPRGPTLAETFTAFDAHVFV